MQILDKRKDIKKYNLMLKNKVTSFLVGYRKRYNAFPISTINKLVRQNNYKVLAKLIIYDVPIDSKVALSDMQKRYKDIKGKLNPSYYNPVIRGFNVDAKKASDSNSIKGIFVSIFSVVEKENPLIFNWLKEFGGDDILS